MFRFTATRLAFAALAVPLAAAAAQFDGPPSPLPPTTQLIVKFRSTDAREMTPGMTGIGRAMTAERMGRVTQAAGLQLGYRRAMSGNAHVLALPHPMSEEEAADAARRIAALSDVEYAEPDRWMVIQSIPDDPGYANQWDLQDPAAGDAGSANLPGAWDLSNGNGITVAVIDTGVLNHADLRANLVGGKASAAGYDMVSLVSAANSGMPGSNDGNGRDADPTDPGDWVAANAPTCGTGTLQRSSWHGTHVAGTIAAVSNNGTGIAGIATGAKILAVRALGSCGGYTSDIADGIVWASGGSVAGVPANTHPARVINLSLAGSGPCDTTTQNAINAAVARGATVVVAAGNSDTTVSDTSPANCSDVVTVAAVGPIGARAYYSNYDAGTSYVALAAPGGDAHYAYPSGMIYSTYNSGTTTAANDAYGWLQGTSMATPHVTGVVALMLAANHRLTDGTIPAAQVPGIIRRRLRSTARPFPNVSGACTTATCGAGILDAAAAVASVNRAPIVSSDCTGSASAGSTVTLGCGVTDDGLITGYHWSQTGGPAVTLSDATAAHPTFTAPAQGATLTFQVTVTDDVLLSGGGTATITTTAPQSAGSAGGAGSSSGGGDSGGGGALEWPALLLGAWFGRRRRMAGQTDAFFPRRRS